MERGDVANDNQYISAAQRQRAASKPLLEPQGAGYPPMFQLLFLPLAPLSLGSPKNALFLVAGRQKMERGDMAILFPLLPIHKH
jgi:hypothetical protein